MSDSEIPAYVIRSAAPHDALELARLLTALGHPTTADSITARWSEWTAAGNTGLVAARSDQALVGVATMHQMLVLHRAQLVGRITALVVDDTMRRQGIGRKLMAAAEMTLAQAGCGLIEITSNMRRADAHAFYEGLGYERTSFRFAKFVRPAG